MLNSNEPVRIAGVIAGVVVGVSTFFTTWGNDLDWRLAVGAGLAQIAVVSFGAELARLRAWGPRTVDTIMDAETVIGAAERGGEV